MAETDFLSSMRQMMQDQFIDLNTSIPGEVVTYSGGLATIKPTGNKQFKDGASLPFPLVHNVPIQWPSFNGGQCGMKAPIMPGDKVLLVFSQQAGDGTGDRRRHDLSDAYAIPSGNSQIHGGLNNDDTIMFFGDASIRITKAGAIIIKAPGGVTVDAPDTTYTGNIASTGAVVNNGKSVGSVHTHGGVQTGSGTTGQVS
jgi:hypothetical protein